MSTQNRRDERAHRHELKQQHSENLAQQTRMADAASASLHWFKAEVVLVLASIFVAGLALKYAHQSANAALRSVTVTEQSLDEARKAVQATRDGVAAQTRPWIGVKALPRGKPRVPRALIWEIDVTLVLDNYGVSPAVDIAIATELTAHGNDNSVLPERIASACHAAEQYRVDGSQAGDMHAEHVVDVFPKAPIDLPRPMAARWRGLERGGGYLTLIGCVRYGVPGSTDVFGETPFAFDLVQMLPGQACAEFLNTVFAVGRAGRMDLYRWFGLSSTSASLNGAAPRGERELCLIPTGGLGISIK